MAGKFYRPVSRAPGSTVWYRSHSCCTGLSGPGPNRANLVNPVQHLVKLESILDLVNLYRMIGSGQTRTGLYTAT